MKISTRARIGAVLLALSTACLADGPGTRIRLGPPPVPHTTSPPAERDLARCESMRDEQKRRCMQALRAAAVDPKTQGPESTGAGPAAGSGAGAGASGAMSSPVGPR